METVYIIACPGCEKKIPYDVRSSYRPFCSPACRDKDLINWADDNYVIGGEDSKDAQQREKEALSDE